MSSIPAIIAFRSSTATAPSSARGATAANTEGQFNFPYGIAVDKEGCVYVVDSGNNRVLKYVPTDEEINRGKDEKPKSQGRPTTPPPSNVA